jgi:translocator protein
MIKPKAILMKDIFKLCSSVLACLAVGFAGSFFTNSSIGSWYAGLKKPFFNPPSWIFAPAWTILYVLMGVSAFLIWRQGLDKERIRTALFAFIIQLALNALWSPAFFGMKSELAGLGVITFLWAAITITIFLFYHISKLASFLLLPYILWVSFALVLNAAIFVLNP